MRLQKLLMCMSRKRTLTYLDTEGKDHDREVRNWRDVIENVMIKSQVTIERSLSHPFHFKFMHRF